jgi:hypothetical protein
VLAPEVAAQWHPTKNGALTSREVAVHSNRLAWWKCPKGDDHEWQIRIASRTKPNEHTGCPFCSNRRVSKTNVLAGTFPKVARQWHPTKNGELTPRDVTRNTNRYAWWRCAFGHEWRALISQRTRVGTGCPHCYRQRGSQAAAVTGKRRRHVRLAEYEGARHGPVRRVR